MSGSAGLSPSRNRKPEGSTLSEYARNSKRECAALVAGPAVLTAEIKLSQSWTIRNVGSVQGDASLASPPRHLAIGYVDIKQRQPILERLQCKTTKHESDAKNSQRPLWKIVREVFEEGTDHLK